MPEVRRRSLQARRELSERTLEHLSSGHDWGFLDGVELSFEELRAAYLAHREQVLEYHAATDGTGPCSWGEWMFDRKLSDESFYESRFNG